LYYDYLKEQVDELKNPITKQIKSLEKFKNNLLSGVDYYKDLSQHFSGKFQNIKEQIQSDLNKLELEIKNVHIS